MTKTKSTNKALKVATSAALIASSFSTIVAPISASSSFPDIAGNYHENDILQLLERKIIQGYPDGTFKPANSITRGQAAKMIASVLNLDTKNITNPGFSDVDDKHEFYPYIAALAKEGIINGYEDGTFKQDATITRGQMAKMIALGFNLTSDENHPFTDVAEGSIYTPYIKALFNHEVTKGTTDTTFSPRNSVSRGQLASFVIRAENAVKASVNSDIVGTIEEVLADAIIIDGRTVIVPANFSKVLTTNKQALKGAKIALSTADGEVTKINTLELATNATSFDGNGVTINTLSIPTSVKTIANITAETIHYQVTDQALTANNVNANDFYLNNQKIILASITNVNLPSNVANVTFNGSTIENVHSNVDEATISKTNTKIKNIHATNTMQLTLNGDYATVTISSNTNISGTANIETLIFEEQPSSYIVAAGISVSKVNYANQTYTWNDFIEKFPPKQQEGAETSTEDSASVAPEQNGPSGGGTSTGNDTSSGGNSSGESNTDNGSSNGNDNSDKPSTGDGSSNSGDNSDKPSTGDGSSNGGDNSGESNSGTESEDNNAENNETSVDITFTDPEINIQDDKVSIILTNEDNTTVEYTVSEPNLQKLFTTYSDNIASVDITSSNNEVTGINNIVLDNVQAFDGKLLEDVQIEQLTLTNTNTITNVTTATNLNVVTDGIIDFSNTVANVTVQGNVEEITGLSGENLTIIPVASTVNLENVSSKNIIIENSPVLARSLMRSAFASLNLNTLAATQSSLIVTFSSADTSQTVTVNREDTILDVQKGAFSKINVTQNNVDIRATQSLTQVIVSAGVTYLTLRASAEKLAVTLEHPLVLVGSGDNITIDNLAITTTKSAPETNGWLELVNITAKSATLNNGELLSTNNIYKKPETTPLPTFTSSFEAKSFLEFKINTTVGSGESLRIATVGKNVDITPYLATMPASTTPYTQGTYIPLYTDVQKVLIYKLDGSGNPIGVSVLELPINYPNIALKAFDTVNESVTLMTRYRDTDSPNDSIGHLYIIQSGKLVYQQNGISEPWNKIDNINTLKIALPFDLKGQREIYITKDVVLSTNDQTVSKYPSDYIEALKILSSEAARLNNNAMIVPVLDMIFAETSSSYDSYFLSKYVEELNKAPGNYTTIDSLENLSNKIKQENSYEKDAVLTANDLYLTGALKPDFTYSTNGIVKNSLSDTGELLFTPIASGSTTVRVTDSNGNASLVNVTVSNDKKITTKPVVLKADVTAGTLLDGDTTFRTAPNAPNILLPTKLEKSFALIESGTDYKGISLTNNNGSYELSAVRDITLTELTFAEIGLTKITGASDSDVGILTTNTSVVLYPKAAGKDTILLTDGTYTTAINTDSTVEEVTAKPVKSYNSDNSNKVFTFADLGLNNIQKTTPSPANPGFFLVQANGAVQLFGNNISTGSITLEDSQGKKAIINTKIEQTTNGLEVTQFDILKATIPSADTVNLGATVTLPANASVRVDGLTVYAVTEGSTTLTLSNGKQYEVTVTKNAQDQYVMSKLTEVSNFSITAAELHMTNINQVTSSNGSSDTLHFDSSRLVLNRPTDGTSMLTVISNTEPTERTIVYVTKTDNDYTAEVVKDVTTSADTLGLTSIEEVIGSKSPYARALATVDKKLVVYGYEAGTRSFQVSDGTNKTAVNVEVKEVNGKLTQTVTPVAHTLTPGYTPATGEFKTTAAFLKGGTLYATGEGLTNNKAKIEMPLTNGATYVIELTFDPATNHYSFAAAPTITFNKAFTKEELGLSTLTSVSAATNIAATKDENNISLAITGDVTGSRIEVTGVSGSDSNAKTFIHVTRNGDALNATVEKSAVPIDLTTYGYEETPTGSLDKNIARANISADLKNLTFYSLENGTALYTLTDTAGKKLLINLKVVEADTGLRTVTPAVVETTIDTGTAEKILEGSSIRLSADNKKVYATGVGSTKVLLTDGSIVQYEVKKDASTNEYIITATPLASALTINADDIGLTGPITAVADNNAIVSMSTTSDGKLLVYGSTSGKTSLVITDSTGNKSRVNITVDNSLAVTLDSPQAVQTAINNATNITIINTTHTNKVRISNNKLYALEEGTIQLLVETAPDSFAIYETVIKKAGNHFEISTPDVISIAVYNPGDLGFQATSAMQIENGYSENFTVKEVAGKIVAYSNLQGTTTGNTEFVVKSQDDNLRTLVRLKDTGAAVLESKIAIQDETFGGTNPTSIADETIARFKDGKLYTLRTGYTYATVDSKLQAINVTRDADGYLKAEVQPLTLSGTDFAALAGTETDTNIVGISADGTTLYAKGLGTTKVKEGNIVKLITVGANANEPFKMTATALSSKFVSANDLGLTTPSTTEIIHGAANSVTINREDAGLTIYTNGTVGAQTLAIRVADSNGNKAVVNVTIDSTGQITEAKVAKAVINNVPMLTNEQTVTTDTARAVWKDNTITVYALSAASETTAENTALQFDNGLVNVQMKKASNKLEITKAAILAHSLFTATPNTVTNAAMLNIQGNTVYPKATGESLVYVDDKVYALSAKEINGQYELTVSTGVPFITFDLSTISGTFASIDSTFNGAKAAIDEDSLNKKDLIIYADGVGTSDLAINTADGKIIYHATSTGSAMSPLVESVDNLSSTMDGATVKTGTSIRLKGNKIYYQSLGNTVLIKNNRLINANVTRDSNNHFTATPTFVSATLKEDFATASTNFEKDTTNAKLIYALNGEASETFYTTNYRVTAETKLENGVYTVSVDERHMKQFKAPDFGLTGTIVLKDGGNTNANVATPEVNGDTITIYSGTEAKSTTITMTDGTNDVVFNVVRGTDGKIVVTPQAALESLKFADIGLDGTTNAITISEATGYSYDKSIINVTPTDKGLNITAKKNGATALALVQDNKIVGLVNVTVETVNNNLQVTATPISYTVNAINVNGTANNDGVLVSSPAISTRLATKYYPISTGYTLYKTDTGAAYVKVTRNGDLGLYSVVTSEHTLSTITNTQAGLDKISGVSLKGSSVAALTNTDKSEVYIYGTNPGFTDVILTNGTQYTTVVANNNTSLTTTVASKTLDLEDNIAADWTSNLVEIRNHVIYAARAGNEVATADLGTHKALMNISISRNTGDIFSISYDIVDATYTESVTVIEGDSVKALDKKIYAQKEGVSKIKVGSNIYQITVTKGGDGLYKLEASQPLVQKTIPATDFGLTTASTATIHVITGTGVIDARIIGSDIVIYAQNAGQAQVEVSDGTNKAYVHVLVTSNQGVLSIKETLARKQMTGVTDQLDGKGIMRGESGYLYALAEGRAVSKINNELYVLSVTKQENVLMPDAQRVEAILPGEVFVPTDDTVLIVDPENNNNIIAIGFGTVDVTVNDTVNNKTRTFRVKVSEDGLITYNELLGAEIDVTNILSTVDTVSTTLTTFEKNGKKVTLTPKAAGTEIITISDGTSTIQARVTVTGEPGSLTATAEILSASFTASTVGFYPTSITLPSGAEFTSQQGVVKLQNGTITLYPGAIGTTHFIIEGNNRSAMYELKIQNDYSYSFGKFKQTVEYDAFKSYTTVLDHSGSATATVGTSGLDVTFTSTDETVFVVTGESGYKTLLVQASINGEQFEVAPPLVQEALVVDGEASNVNGGLRSVKDGSKTVIYADKDTEATASYTAGSKLYNVTVSQVAASKYKLTPVEIIESAGAYTSATHVQNDDVAVLEGNVWKAKAAGTGIYRTNDGNYVEVEVKLSNGHYEIEIGQPLDQIDVSTIIPTTDSSTVTINSILSEGNELYIDGTKIYGNIVPSNDATNKIAISVQTEKGKLLLTGTKFTDFAIEKASIKNLLSWTKGPVSNSLNANSTVLRIDGDNIYPIGDGSEVITFKSPNGLSRTITVTVIKNANGLYKITYTPSEKNIVEYTVELGGDHQFTASYMFTFDTSVDLVEYDITTNTEGSVADPDIDSQIQLNSLSFDNFVTSKTIKAKFTDISTDEIFTIQTTARDQYIITMLNGSTVQLNKVETFSE